MGSLLSIFISVTLVLTGFLFVLNLIFVFSFRKGKLFEVLSYLLAALVELAIFGVLVAFRSGILTSIPYHLPPGLPVNRAEFGAAFAIGVGLFPIAYWHRNSARQLRTRIAEDTKSMKTHESGVYVRNNTPGEWMN